METKTSFKHFAILFVGPIAYLISSFIFAYTVMGCAASSRGVPAHSGVVLSEHSSEEEELTEETDLSSPSPKREEGRGKREEISPPVSPPAPPPVHNGAPPAQMLPFPNGQVGAVVQGTPRTVTLSPAFHHRQWGYTLRVYNRMKGGRLLAIENLTPGSELVPCEGNTRGWYTVINVMNRRPVAVMPAGSEACLVLPIDKCRGNEASCHVRVGVVRYSPAPPNSFARAERKTEQTFRFPNEQGAWHLSVSR